MEGCDFYVSVQQPKCDKRPATKIWLRRAADLGGATTVWLCAEHLKQHQRARRARMAQRAAAVRVSNREASAQKESEK